MVGGLLGSLVGFKKLDAHRLEDKAQIDQKFGSSIQDNNIRSFVDTAIDTTRSVGYIGLHGMWGSLVYPMVPPVLLPYLIKSDLKRSSIL